jgi:hypothetical protein
MSATIPSRLYRIGTVRMNRICHWPHDTVSLDARLPSLDPPPYCKSSIHKQSACVASPYTAAGKNVHCKLYRHSPHRTSVIFVIVCNEDLTSAQFRQ